MNNKILTTLDTSDINSDIKRAIIYYLSMIGETSKRGIQQSVHELDQTIHRIKTHNKSYSSFTEIGSSEGGSLWIYANILVKPGGAINIVEINIKEPLRIVIKQLETLGFKVNVYEQNDEATAMAIKETDIIHIDGDHSYEGVKADFFRYYPITKKAVILHDTALWPGCIRLKNELFNYHLISYEYDDCLHVLRDDYDDSKATDYTYLAMKTGTSLILK